MEAGVREGGDGRDAGIMDVRREATACSLKLEIQGDAKMEEVSQQSLSDTEPCFSFLERGCVNCLIKGVCMGKLRLKSWCTHIQYLDSFSDILSYSPNFIFFFLRLCKTLSNHTNQCNLAMHTSML